MSHNKILLHAIMVLNSWINWVGHFRCNLRTKLCRETVTRRAHWKQYTWFNAWINMRTTLTKCNWCMLYRNSKANLVFYTQFLGSDYFRSSRYLVASGTDFCYPNKPQKVSSEEFHLVRIDRWIISYDITLDSIYTELQLCVYQNTICFQATTT